MYFEAVYYVWELHNSEPIANCTASLFSVIKYFVKMKDINNACTENCSQLFQKQLCSVWNELSPWRGLFRVLQFTGGFPDQNRSKTVLKKRENKYGNVSHQFEWRQCRDFHICIASRSRVKGWGRVIYVNMGTNGCFYRNCYSDHAVIDKCYGCV